MDACGHRWAGGLLATVAACATVEERSAQAPVVVCPRGPTVQGIDVSVYQGTVDFDTVRRAGLRFVIARVAHGTARDANFERNWQAIRAAGLIRGAYLYVEPSQDADAQAELVVQAVGRLGPGDLPVALDIEKPPPVPPVEAYAALVRRLVARIAAGTGRRPMIYTGRRYWPAHVRTAEFASLPLWHAQYTAQRCASIAEAWRAWVFWQYSSTGRVAGVRSPVDLDVFNGDLRELEDLAALPRAGDAGADGRER